MKFEFKYSFQGNKYVSTIEAQSQYAAQIKFNEFILSKIKIESIEEEQSKQDPSVEFLKGVFGMKTVLLLCVLSFASCRRDLAKECSQKYPCTVTKERIDSIVYHTDTLRIWESLSSIPILKIRCFEYNAKDSLEIYSIPCNSIISEKEIWRTQYFEDSAKIFVFMQETTQLRKDSAKIAQKLIDSNNQYDKYHYFFKWGFILTWLAIVLLAAFAIYRKTKKV